MKQKLLKNGCYYIFTLSSCGHMMNELDEVQGRSPECLNDYEKKRLNDQWLGHLTKCRECQNQTKTIQTVTWLCD